MSFQPSFSSITFLTSRKSSILVGERAKIMILHEDAHQQRKVRNAHVVLADIVFENHRKSLIFSWGFFLWNLFQGIFLEIFLKVFSWDFFLGFSRVFQGIFFTNFF